MTYILYMWAMVEIVLILYALYNIKKIITIYREDKQMYYYASDKIEGVLTQVYGEHKILSFLVSEMMILLCTIWMVCKKEVFC